jgi:pimeloyl-ACP methyl ester carboxylesterase
MPDYLPHFRTSEGEAAYRLAYQRTLALWPPNCRSIDVMTQFGLTHLTCLGDPADPPLLMLHGFGFSSVQWYPNAPILAADFCIYAPDVPDQLGLSQLVKPLQTPENYALWVAELLDALAIPSTPIVGHSYGGWLAANFALRFPQRVTRLTLISPAATFVPLSWQFFVRGILGGATHQDWIIYSMVSWMTTLPEVHGLPIVEQFKIGMKNMAQIPAGFPTVFTQDEFKALTIPVQLIIGDHEVIYTKPPASVIETARNLIPHLQVASISGGGHAVTLDQPALVNAALVSFHHLNNEMRVN